MLEVVASQLAGGIGKGLGNAIGGDGGPFVGGAAHSGAYGTVLDGSGWVVNLGGQQSATASPVRTQVQPDPAGFLTPGATQAGPGVLGWVLLAVGAAWIIKRKT